MNRIEDTTIEAALEHLIADCAGGIGPALTPIFEPDDIIIQADIHIVDIHHRMSRQFELQGNLDLAQL